MIAVAYFEQIESAQRPGDLFSGDTATASNQYRRLARVVHPDANPDDVDRATKVFARLSELWATYTGTNNSSDIVYVTRRNTYRLNPAHLISRGDISNVYEVFYIANARARVGILKMPRSPKNNDLVANEISALKTLKDEVPDKWHPFHPTTIDSFRHHDAKTSKDRRAIVLDNLNGFVSLRDILDAYPHGIDPRDMAWMARRLWIAIDTAHDAGLVHGAVFPEHVMVHPESHGVVLIDWSYSRPKGEKLNAVVKRYMDLGWYGSRYDQPLDHRLDIRQAAHTLELLLGDKGNRPFRAFFNGCRVASTPPAGTLFREFDELLERLYGERRYRPFHMPAER